MPVNTRVIASKQLRVLMAVFSQRFQEAGGMRQQHGGSGRRAVLGSRSSSGVPACAPVWGPCSVRVSSPSDVSPVDPVLG